MIFQGIRTSIAKKPYIFVIVQGGGGRPPLDPRMLSVRFHRLCMYSVILLSYRASIENNAWFGDNAFHCSYRCSSGINDKFLA